MVYKPTTGETTRFELHNTIIANNVTHIDHHDECFVLNGVVITGSNNLIVPHLDDVRKACPGVTQAADPQLAPLTLNPPGRTPTMAISTTSPAFDTGNPGEAPLDDQRGVARPQYGTVDIGAYEAGGDTPPPTDTTPPTATPTQAPIANGNGWNNSAVAVTWNWVNDPGGSGLDPNACTISTSSTGEGVAIQLAATCSDLAGNTGNAAHTVNVDTTAPTVTCAATPRERRSPTPPPRRWSPRSASSRSRSTER